MTLPSGIDIAAPEKPNDRRAAFHALLRGEAGQRFLTSAWQHPVGEEYEAERFAAATVEFNRTWDWDWVKINPRAVYYAEAWGSIYDPDDYHGVVPRLVTPAVASVADLAAIRPLDPRHNEVFAEHLASARLIRNELPDRALLQTVFSPLSVLLQLAGLPLYPGVPVAGSTAPFTFADLVRSDPDGVRVALTAIAQTLADYVRALLAPPEQGGARLDGIFYAVTGTASAGYFDRNGFAEHSRPHDLTVLAAATAGAAIVHTCGPHAHPEWFTDYPISALHWDQFQPGNPPLETSIAATAVGGVNNQLFAIGSDLTQVDAQLRTALAADLDRPFLLAPSCTIPTPADPASLQRLRDAS